MILFDWRRAEDVDAPWWERFERGAHPDAAQNLRGVGWWRDVGERRGPAMERYREPEHGPGRGAWRPPRPVLFVSHRRTDEAYARHAADVAEAEGFDVWLDVLDPKLNQLQAVPENERDEQWSLMVARIIEVALVNATHLTVVRTPRVDGSTWVPYEYGRARDADTLTDAASCWIAEETDTKPEYLLLGVMAHSEDDLRDWLRRERAAWGHA